MTENGAEEEGGGSEHEPEDPLLDEILLDVENLVQEWDTAGNMLHPPPPPSWEGAPHIPFP
jgi:hypothetical protein